LKKVALLLWNNDLLPLQRPASQASNCMLQVAYSIETISKASLPVMSPDGIDLFDLSK